MAKKRSEMEGKPDRKPEILQRLSDGESLLAICKTEGYPAESTVRSWVMDDVDGFAANYTRARELGYERLADELLAIADTPIMGQKSVSKATGVEITEGDMIEHRRLQVDTRKWMLSKMLPKRFGDKLAIGGADDMPAIKTDGSITIEPAEAYKRMLGGA